MANSWEWQVCHNARRVLFTSAKVSCNGKDHQRLNVALSGQVRDIRGATDLGPHAHVRIPSDSFADDETCDGRSATLYGSRFSEPGHDRRVVQQPAGPAQRTTFCPPFTCHDRIVRVNWQFYEAFLSRPSDLPVPLLSVSGHSCAVNWGRSSRLNTFSTGWTATLNANAPVGQFIVDLQWSKST